MRRSTPEEQARAIEIGRKLDAEDGGYPAPDTTDLRVAACNFRESARSVRPHPANPHVVRASDVAHFVDMDCAVIAQRVDEAADTIASLEAALKECVAVMGETLDKDFGFWSSPAQDDRRSRFYPAWKQGHTALKGQTP